MVGERKSEVEEDKEHILCVGPKHTMMVSPREKKRNALNHITG